MESKKINQLATAMSPSSTDLTIIGDPISGVSKKATLQQISSLFGSAVSFYTNLAAFPATGTIDTLYCAKDTNKLYLWSGSAYVQTFPSQSLLDTYQLKSEKGASNGYASLDSSGKVPISQLPSSIMEYKGMWNASTNTPTLANGTGDTGDVYICNAAGTVNFGAGAITFAVGDYVVYSGTIWQRSSGAVGTVTSVAVTETGDALTITGSPVTTSGTINIGFAGTSAQYVAGDGSLVTFPTVVTQAQNLVTEVYNETGATLTKGTVVYINGGHGNLPTITKAIATGDATSAQTYGVVRTDITNNNNGYVTVIGNLDNIDTQAYAAGTQLYLSSTTAGAWTSVKQYAPAHLVYVGIVTRSHPTQGVVEIKIQNGFELDELHNVSAQTPSNNQGLFYNSSNSLWENKSIATALGYTPADDSLVVKLAGTQTITGEKTFSSTYGITIDGNGTNAGGINFKLYTGASARGFGYSTIYSVNSNIFAFYYPIDSSNNSKQFKFDLTSLTTNAPRTYLMPDANGTLALTSDIPSLTGYITGTGTSGYIPYFNGTSSVTGTSNLFWDNTNKFLGIGTNAPSAGVTSYSTTAATQFKAAGTAPAFTFSNTLTSPTYGCVFGLATANGHFVTGTAPGDMAIANQSTTAGAIVFGTGTTEKMRMTAAGTFSIGNTNSTYNLDVTGTGRFTSTITANGFYANAGNSARFYRSANDYYWSINSDSSNYLNFGTYLSNGTAYGTNPKLILLDNGNVGIGTTTPTTYSLAGKHLELYGGTDYSFFHNNTATVKSFYAINEASLLAALFTFSAHPLTFGTSNTERMRISSTGLVGIGTSAPRIALEAVGTDAASSSSATPNGAIMVSNPTAANSQVMTMGVANGSGNHSWIQSRNSTTANFYALALNPVGGNVGIGTTSPFSQGSSPTSLEIAGTNFGQLFVSANSGAARGTLMARNGTSDVYIGAITNSPLAFGTNDTERMRITSGGNLLVGATSDVGGKLQVLSGDTAEATAHLQLRGNFYTGFHFLDGTAYYIGQNSAFRSLRIYSGATSTVGVNLAAGGTSWGTYSDERLKENIDNIDSVLPRLSTLRTVKYHLKNVDTEDSQKRYGLIAQDLVGKFDEVLNLSKYSDEDTTEYYNVRYTELIPILVKAIQELKLEIDELKNK